MDKQVNKQNHRARRKIGTRKVVEGTPQRPRLSIYKSLNHMYAQIIDDLAGKTIVAASTAEGDIKKAGADKTGNAKAAEAVGTALAQRATKAGVKQVVFDRNGFRFHGRVKALADAARKAGLDF